MRSTRRVRPARRGRAAARRGSSYATIAWLFAKGLGVVYFVAFRSLRGQVRGLYGRRGILPVREWLDDVRRLTGRERYRLVPSLLWLRNRDDELVRWCDLGEWCAVALVVGAAPRLAAAACWTLYLSFVSAGREFLGYQWDALLVEAGLDALWVLPRGVVPRPRRDSPPWAGRMLMRWLVFRLHFESGIAKLQSQDPTWRSCTACAYHYWTQPLPTALGWYAHHLPRAAQRASTALALAVEGPLPFLAFAPRRARRFAFVVLTAFQGLIAATGNYAFFNLLTALLGLWLLDDASVAALAPRRPAPPRARWWRQLAAAIAALPGIALSGAKLWARLRRRATMPRPLLRLHRALVPWHAVNSYGLFAVMTTERPEIVIEGSYDGVQWREYVLPYKPGPLDRAPRTVAPHQPRLDWQLWFAALSPLPPAWFPRLLQRLLEGAPEVLALFSSAPFPAEAPPRYVRALLYHYEMTDLATRRATGAWWRRTLVGTYFPECTLPAPAIG